MIRRWKAYKGREVWENSAARFLDRINRISERIKRMREGQILPASSALEDRAIEANIEHRTLNCKLSASARGRVIPHRVDWCGEFE